MVSQILKKSTSGCAFFMNYSKFSHWGHLQSQCWYPVQGTFTSPR